MPRVSSSYCKLLSGGHIILLPLQIISQLDFSTITFTIRLDNVYIEKDMYLEKLVNYNLKWREYKLGKLVFMGLGEDSISLVKSSA